MMAVSVRNIKKSYGKAAALRGLSFEAEKGELFGLTGPDGAGKTSLFRILATLLLADEGTASVDGLDVVSDYREIRRRVGYMPGRFSLYPDLTVEENLSFFASVFGTAIPENYELIEDIYKQIEPFKTRRAGKLSGGMKQKLALSCALIHRPSVLFLDEPTTGVDPVSRREFWQMLRRLQAQDITILVSTPYMDEAALCDRIALMREGEFLTVDTPAGIVEKFVEPLYAVSSANMSRLLPDIRRMPEVGSCYAFGDVHHAVMAEDLPLPVMEERLKRAGHADVCVYAIRASVEDCFMKLNQEGNHAGKPV
ncbi:MAG: ABC transporter ATP-binding protein [Tannerella sp.]|jgi:ABC-type multidrug transport system ATPase subunit|nr:ABC transporter ATP-binding protein [Tannerella sp.]